MNTPEKRERNRIAMAIRRANNPEVREKDRKSALAWAANHKEERRLYMKTFRLKRDYGLTLDEFDAMLAKQHGKCAICGVFMDPPARAAKNSIAVTVDHCHATNVVRGLLCYSCNLGLGIFKDCLQRMRSAIIYLEQAEQRNQEQT